MASNNKDIGRLLREATKAGAVVERATRHYRVRFKGRQVTVAVSTSDRRAYLNIVCDLRRIGLDLRQHG